MKNNLRSLPVSKEQFNLFAEHEKLLILATAGTYAASSHNTQPWNFKITTNSIRLFPDYSRILVHSDPEKREFFLSIGTAFENIKIAAKAYGLIFTDILEDDLSQTINFQSLFATNADVKMINALCHRHNSHDKFYQKKILPEHKIKLIACVEPEANLSLIDEQKEQLELKNHTLNCVRAAFKNKHFKDELSLWVKPNLNLGMPGYYLGIPFPISYLLPWIIKSFDTSLIQTAMHKSWLDSSPAYGILSSEDENPKSQILTGRAFQKLAVLAQSLDIRVGVMGAAMEINEGSKKIKKLLNLINYPQIFFRLGYGLEKDPKNFSPRLKVNHLLKL